MTESMFGNDVIIHHNDDFNDVIMVISLLHH